MPLQHPDPLIAALVADVEAIKAQNIHSKLIEQQLEMFATSMLAAVLGVIEQGATPDIMHVAHIKARDFVGKYPFQMQHNDADPEKARYASMVRLVDIANNGKPSLVVQNTPNGMGYTIAYENLNNIKVTPYPIYRAPKPGETPIPDGVYAGMVADTRKQWTFDYGQKRVQMNNTSTGDEAVYNVTTVEDLVL